MEDLENMNWCEYSVYEVVAERDVPVNGGGYDDDEEDWQRR